MPEKVECRYCGRINDLGGSECVHCSATLTDAIKRVSCEKCGIQLPDGIDQVGSCVTCGKAVYLCDKHKAKVMDDEVYCHEHISECLIATAVFGTPLDPRLDELRYFRDQHLLSNPLGRAFVYTYYELSPPIARAARRNGALREILRRVIVQPALRFTRTLLS
ncbi:MAG: CFI-box-CTERM domain-containing protein [Candidatus Thorarchaeota archaeon]